MTETAYTDAVEEQRKKIQQTIPHVEWQRLDEDEDKFPEAKNVWHFKYLGSIIMTADGRQDKDGL